MPSGASNRLQDQSSGKFNLWQGCREFTEESSKIVPLGAPLFSITCRNLCRRSFSGAAVRASSSCRFLLVKFRHARMRSIIWDFVLLWSARHRRLNWGVRFMAMEKFMNRNVISAVATLYVFMMSYFAWGQSSAATPTLFSKLETIDIESKVRTVVYAAPEHFEAPNWTHDGAFFLFNQDGRIYRLPVAGGKPEVIDTGFAIRCNNDHGISPDSKFIVISDQSQGDLNSIVYTVPFGGGAPHRITQNSPSYWHGWSPDGSTLAFVGERNGDFDIYSIPAAGGAETQLTTAKGLDDGPEYSPDGKYIYFNSVRTGIMQIWRMRPDGGEQEQITHDDFNDWFPHISPDGKWMVILSYDKSVMDHPPNKDVALRLISREDGKISVLAKLFGGQGTINVPSWSPDSKRLAFVSYELADPASTK